MTTNKLVLAERFLEPTMAEIARAALEDAEIPCFLFDNNHSAVNFAILFAVGGSRLMVHEKDYERAQSVLAELRETAEPDLPREKSSLLNIFLSVLITALTGAPTPLKEKRKSWPGE